MRLTLKEIEAMTTEAHQLLNDNESLGALVVIGRLGSALKSNDQTFRAYEAKIKELADQVQALTQEIADSNKSSVKVKTPNPED
jgi:DNA repair ATPase RecN